MKANRELINEFKGKASSCGVRILEASVIDEAIAHIGSLIKEKNIATVIKSACPLASRLGLSLYMEKSGLKIYETAFIQHALKLKQNKEVPLEEMALFISSATGEKIAAEPGALLTACRSLLKAIYNRADLGITEADFGIAESGKIIKLGNEDNARLAAVLPRLHLVLLQANQVVATLADAANSIKHTSGRIPGHELGRYISNFTGSKAASAGSEQFAGCTKGPEEEYVLILHGD